MTPKPKLGQMLHFCEKGSQKLATCAFNFKQNPKWQMWGKSGHPGRRYKRRQNKNLCRVEKMVTKVHPLIGCKPNHVNYIVLLRARFFSFLNAKEF
jgi:hypothetical protein